ncbi:uncharacterized protein PHACADRAFT_213363 [Phanerochaete carnosa HHB-10118-sp]|uniref:Endoplasmic reticulum-based factor for assembly of V-ATPase n=1 Tax=Phanerochaete carnosa (strain HHB-10118-sp) TaxID=650164 RepID=K5VUG9_PHACS|nr:uncharacterized protein PHACADRAFT_213363 [Phanerochaete carnosa HHB-10118-sp]EKM50440.1 hypothetical protein PHACADRAFT_213363 [Phanerochaete carnosa HHB-10118-sp]
MSTATDFNVSLEPHLADALRPLVPILPEVLSKDLSTTLDSAAKTAAPSPPTAAEGVAEAGDAIASAPPLIPYSLLSSISAWTRSPDGHDALSRCDSRLEPTDYTMVALLAGTRTSPEKNFPHMPVKPEASEEAHRELNDRRAVTAVLNALLSVIGSGVATWWAADRLNWKPEWKALLALFVAIVVAVSEAILFMIWDARRSKRITKLSRALRSQDASTLISDGEQASLKAPEDGLAAERTHSPNGKSHMRSICLWPNLRRRPVYTSTSSEGSVPTMRSMSLTSSPPILLVRS